MVFCLEEFLRLQNERKKYGTGEWATPKSPTIFKGHTPPGGEGVKTDTPGSVVLNKKFIILLLTFICDL
jgi:hypothetical protein